MRSPDLPLRLPALLPRPRRHVPAVVALALATTATVVGGPGAAMATEAAPPTTTSPADASAGPLAQVLDGELPALTPTASSPQIDAPPRTRIGVRLRLVGEPGVARSDADARRLTPFPTAKAPVALLLGPVADTGRVAFLVSDEAMAWGEGTCTLPTAGCPALELAAGETELLDQPTPSGAVRRYALTVTSVGRTTSAQVGPARSGAGVRLLRRAIRVGSPVPAAYRWSAARGVLER